MAIRGGGPVVRLLPLGGKWILREARRNCKRKFAHCAGQLALRRPYTFVVMALLIIALGTLAILRMPTDTVRLTGRATQGVTIIDLEENDKVVSIARLVDKEEEDTAASAVPEPPSEPDARTPMAAAENASNTSG